MNNDEFDAQMRKMEIYHSYRVPENCYIVVRLDGRKFSKLTKNYEFEKPFDYRFSSIMINTTMNLVKEFDANYGYVESDEISLLFRREWDFCDREIEKILSLTASFCSSSFTIRFVQKMQNYFDIPDKPICFDSRIIPIYRMSDVVDYFRWRQSDSKKNALNAYAYWTLRQNEKKSKGQATSELNGKGPVYKQEILTRNGINWEEVESQFKYGTGIYWKYIDKEGFNPKTQETVMTKRKVLEIDENLPMGDDYKAFIERLG